MALLAIKYFKRNEMRLKIFGKRFYFRLLENVPPIEFSSPITSLRQHLHNVNGNCQIFLLFSVKDRNVSPRHFISKRIESIL